MKLEEEEPRNSKGRPQAWGRSFAVLGMRCMAMQRCKGQNTLGETLESTLSCVLQRELFVPQHVQSSHSLALPSTVTQNQMNERSQGAWLVNIPSFRIVWWDAVARVASGVNRGSVQTEQ